jgi:hypothetical protein
MAANNSKSASGGGGGGDELSLCLTSRQGRHIVTLPSTSTTKDLYDTASATFGGIEICSLKYSFPLQVLVSDSTTSLSSLVQNQERIQVEFGSSFSTGNKHSSATVNDAAATKKSTKRASTKTTAPSSTSTTTPADPSISSSDGQRKSRRAAAKAAIESFAEVIKAQDAMMASTTGNKGRGKRKNPSSTPPAKNRKQISPQFATDAGDGRRLADGATDDSLSFSPSKTGSFKKAVTTSPSPNFAKVAGKGRRLADGATVNVPQHRNKTRQSKQQRQQHPPDLSEALLGALNSKGKMGQVLRKGMKNAVAASYETTRAFSRLAAIQAKSYMLQVLGGTGSSLLEVSFVGSVDKTKVQETVDLIPRTVLEAVLRGIYASNQEALRPENISQLSPRVFWSLVQEYPTVRSIQECYTQLLPDLEWNFLQRRAPQLSEKALENLRQEQEKVKGGAVADIMDLDQAAEAIHAVEHAMEHLHDYETTERKARLARAALSRQQQAFNMDSAGLEWTLVTPSEPDRDELLECIQSAPLTCLKENETEQTLIDRLMNTCHIHNWRELANVADPNQLASKLEQEEDVVPQIHHLVERWIDYAQEKSVDEIVVEICNGVPEHVELLTEKARTGTPKDLAAWRCIPEALHKLLISSSSSSVVNDTAQENPSATTPDITVEDLTKWCNRAHKLLQEFEWLNWYATTIE